MMDEIPAIYQIWSLARGQNSQMLITFFRSEIDSKEKESMELTFSLEGVTSQRSCNQ